MKMDKEKEKTIIQKEIIFFSGNNDSSKLMQETLKEAEIEFYLEKVPKSS